MANQPCLDSSLRRLAILGQDVLDRASRRSVDWSSSSAGNRPTCASQTPNTVERRKTHTHLDDAFETIAEFMAQTTYQCKKVYESDYCSEPSDIERTHMSRFHHHTATGMSRPTKKHAHRSASEDFRIEVTPGTYTITADMADSQQQSRLINLKAGETIKLTFDL